MVIIVAKSNYSSWCASRTSVACIHIFKSSTLWTQCAKLYIVRNSFVYVFVVKEIFLLFSANSRFNCDVMSCLSFAFCLSFYVFKFVSGNSGINVSAIAQKPQNAQTRSDGNYRSSGNVSREETPESAAASWNNWPLASEFFDLRPDRRVACRGVQTKGIITAQSLIETPAWRYFVVN